MSARDGKRRFPWMNSFRAKLLIRFSLVMLVVILGMTYALNRSLKERLKEDQLVLQRVKMESCLANLDYYLMNLMGKTDMLFYNKTLSSLLEIKASELTTKVNISKQINALTDTLFFNLKYPEVKTSYYFGGQVSSCLYVRNPSIYLNGTTFQDFADIENQPWIKELMTQRRTFSWNTGFSSKYGPYLAFNRRILAISNMHDIAVLQLRVPLSKISDILNQQIKEDVNFYYYVDADANILVSSGAASVCQEVLKTAQIQGQVIRLSGLEGYYVADVVESDLNGYRLVCAASIEPIYRTIGFITPLVVGTGMAAILLCGICFLPISGSLLKGIRGLIEKTRNVATIDLEQFDTLGHIHASNEIEQLDDAFSEMVATIDRLHKLETQYQRTLTEVQAELLQEQFNPHLLYNTLSMIRYMEQQRGEKALYDVTDNLINFYKSVLNRGQLVTTIQSEMMMIENYLRIVRMVYDIELTVMIEIDEEIHPYCTVKMFLQPIIENAILHGLRHVGKGTLRITGEKVQGHLRFTVSDDGVGMEPAILQEITHMLSEDENSEACKNYGYVSVAKRLKLFFGNAYSMRIESDLGEGTMVEVIIPAMREEDVSAFLKHTFV